MRDNIVIDKKNISSSNSTYIIAEMSANHLQDFERAKLIIKGAKEVGADAIKLQTYRPDTITLDCHTEDFLATPGSPWDGMNLYDLYKTAYTPWEWHKELFEYAREIGITCFSSPFDGTAVDLLEELDAPAYKIASLEIRDIPLIRKVASTGKPVIISTGIADICDIELALDTCSEVGNDNIILLKCVSEYPTPFDELNLRTIPNMRETFKCVVGLSDHSMGSSVPIAAVTLGASVIEKHLTIKRADGGPDGSFSMELSEFQKMVEDIRNIESALGVVTYNLTDKQKKTGERGRSLYVAKDIKRGDRLNYSNIKSVRPGYGLHPKYLDCIVGKRARKDLKYGDPLLWEYIDI